MPVYYSCLLSLGLLLVTIHWTDTASLRSFSRSPSKGSPDRRYPVVAESDEWSTLEPVLSRRRPLLPASERRRRWSDDEIVIDETIVEQSTDTVIIANEPATNSQITSEESSTVAESERPILKQNVIEINQADDSSTIAVNDDSPPNNRTASIDNSSDSTMVDNISSTTLTNEITEIDTTPSEISPTNTTDVNLSTLINLHNLSNIIGNDTETTTSVNLSSEIESEATNAPQTTAEVSTMIPTEVDTAIILLDHTTIFSPTSTAEDNQTSTDTQSTTFVEYNTTVVDEDMNVTTVVNWSATVNLTTVVEQEIGTTTMIADGTQNDTSTVVTDENDYTNETTTSLPEMPAEPICDLSCQCTRECPYGFALVNDTCECDPPCKNYQCFGNDTCILAKDERPFCAPQNGTTHDRPTRCYQPRDAGYHETSMRYLNRWYYNPDQDTCHLFVYRGLGGNENNFQSLHECHLECITCAPAPDPGECLGRLPMWYYDHNKKQCAQFDYSGCKGNDNKFLRKQNCIDTCLTRILNL